MKLSEGFTLVPAGEDIVLLLEKIEAKPKAKPKVIEATFRHENGGVITNKYNLRTDPKTKEIELAEKAAFPFSCLARAVLGNEVKDFSLSQDLPKLAGKYIECEVIHTEPNEKGNVFANIKKTLRMVEPEDMEEEDLDEEDDL